MWKKRCAGYLTPLASDEMIADLPVDGNGPAKDNQTQLPYIILADDNADMREYIKRLLSQSYEVDALPDGQAALTAIKKDCLTWY